MSAILRPSSCAMAAASAVRPARACAACSWCAVFTCSIPTRGLSRWVCSLGTGLVTGALHWEQRSRRAVSVSAACCHNCKIMLSYLDQTPCMDAGPGRRRRLWQRLQLPAGVEGVYALPSRDHVEHHEARWPAVMAAGCSRVMPASSTMHPPCIGGVCRTKTVLHPQGSMPDCRSDSRSPCSYVS